MNHILWCLLCMWLACLLWFRGRVRLDKGILSNQWNGSLSAFRLMIKAIKGEAGIMSSCHSTSPSCWPSVLPAANGSRMSYCGRDFTRKNISSNHSRRFTLNALPNYGSRSPHIGVRVCARPRLCVCEADSKVYLRWRRQLSFLGEDECQTFEVSAISVFVPRLWRKETVW